MVWKEEEEIEEEEGYASLLQHKEKQHSQRDTAYPNYKYCTLCESARTLSKASYIRCTVLPLKRFYVFCATHTQLCRYWHREKKEDALRGVVVEQRKFKDRYLSDQPSQGRRRKRAGGVVRSECPD